MKKILLFIIMFSFTLGAVGGIFPKFAKSAENPQCNEKECPVPPTIPPVVINSCPVPSILGDTTSKTIGNAPEGEQNLQLVLDNASYTLNVNSDQKQFQKWDVNANSTVQINAKFINKFAGYSSVFGFYKNGDLNSFTPIFKTEAIAGYESTPLSTSGPFAINTGNATSIGFAIKTWNGISPAGTLATENSFNTNGNDQVVVYNPFSNKYILGFEDLINGDDDFNDLVVEIILSCEEIEKEPENSAPTANAGPDQIITLPTNSVNLNGTGTDSDGTIASFVWTSVSGPSTINPNDVEDPTASPLVAGTYVFKLTVTDDDGATDDDEVQITVNPAEVTTSSGGGGGGGGGGSRRKQCSDNRDNDNDGLEDEADPGCHSDGNANNSNSYVRSDNNEQDGQVLGAETSCGIYVDKFLRKGYQNDVDSVKEVQQFLNDYMNAGLALDGVYGPLTEAAVENFQLAHAEKVLAPWGITAPTGIFYLTTQTEVNNIMCPTLELPIPSNLIQFRDNPQTPRALQISNNTNNINMSLFPSF